MSRRRRRRERGSALALALATLLVVHALALAVAIRAARQAQAVVRQQERACALAAAEAGVAVAIEWLAAGHPPGLRVQGGYGKGTFDVAVAAGDGEVFVELLDVTARGTCHDAAQEQALAVRLRRRPPQGAGPPRLELVEWRRGSRGED